MSIIEDHLLAVDSYKLEQDKASDKLYTLLNTFITEAQRLEIVLNDLLTKRDISKSFGYTLDILGDIVGEERQLRSDDDYRTAIMIRIFINIGGGTPEDIINAIRILYKPRSLNYNENYPASFNLFIWESSEVSLYKIGFLIKSIRPLGVGQVVITASNADNLFRFSESTSELVNFNINKPPEFNLDVEYSVGNATPLLIQADTIDIALNSFGFGEYNAFLDETTGGGQLAEVIQNGSTT